MGALAGQARNALCAGRASAERKALRLDVDVVLMDVQMPGMDGTVAAQNIRALAHPHKDVPIIAMTANVLPQQIAQTAVAGMDDHFGKPFKRDELFAVIARRAKGRFPRS